MELNLDGKVALVTGGSHGIGLAIAKAFAIEGCKVAICARDTTKINKSLEELSGLTQAKSVLGLYNVDVLQPSNIQNAIKAVIRQWGTIHILVNNVGGGGRWGQSFEDTPEQVWTDVYNKNAMAAIRFTKLALPFMRKQKWGRIVTIASIFGKEGGCKPWFNMAKSAEITLMKNLAMNSDPQDGVTFNTVAPGYILIEGKKVEDYPPGRIGTPEDIANAVAFLCSEKAKFINGACIVVDGGESKSF